MEVPSMTIEWTDRVDQILHGDHALMLGYVTPAKGVVLTPVSNFALVDRPDGVIRSVNSSVGAWKKLDRMRRDPHVSLAFHTRTHGLTDLPEYVLVQGRASLSEPIPDYPSTILERWERFEPWSRTSRLWKRWMKVYALRVEVRIAVERIVVWPDLQARGAPQVIGPALPPPSPPQDPPAK